MYIHKWYTYIENRHVSTEAQSKLNKFKVYKTLVIQNKFIEKKEKKKCLKQKAENVYFLMCICNYEAKSDTESVFWVLWFTACNQF